MNSEPHDLHELVLGCESWQEAQRLTDALLQNELVKAVESLELRSRRWWEQPFNQKYQVKLIIQTFEQDVATIKKEIARLRRRGSQPPYSIPLQQLSAEVSKWLRAATEVKTVGHRR